MFFLYPISQANFTSMACFLNKKDVLRVCVYFLFVLKARRKVYELQSVERILCLITLSSLLKVMSGKAIK